MNVMKPVIADAEARAAHLKLLDMQKDLKKRLRNPDFHLDLENSRMALARIQMLRDYDLVDASKALEISVLTVNSIASRRLVEMDADPGDAEKRRNRIRREVAEELGARDVLDLLESQPEEYDRIIHELAKEFLGRSETRKVNRRGDGY